MAGLTRLIDGQLMTITRRKLVVPLSGDARDVQKRLARYGDFSQINNCWNQTHSDKLARRLQNNSEEWEQYHTLYREARARWSVVPVEEMIKWYPQSGARMFYRALPARRCGKDPPSLWLVGGPVANVGHGQVSTQRSGLGS